MADAENNAAGFEDNYLKDRQFMCIMSPDEIVGISVYMAETVWPSALTRLFSFFHY
jgi:hypothetical protein